MAIDKLEQDGFALVLSGGAALGCAHLGVLDVLEAQELAPREIAGTSMGAIVGAALAAGFSCAQIADSFARFAKVTRWVKFSLRKPGLFNTDRLRAVFGELFGDRTIADVRIPLKIVATDFESGRIKVFTEADAIPLKDAVLCSMSIPVLFPPVQLGGRFYVDGYLSANLPVEQVSGGERAILAVDVVSPRALQPFEQIESFFGKGRAMMAYYERAFHLMVHNQTREALKGKTEVHCLRPALAGFKVYHFDRWEEIRKKGFEEASRFFTS
jgi:NTE family protein